MARCSATNALKRDSPTPPGMCRSRGMSLVLVPSSTLSSPWPPAKWSPQNTLNDSGKSKLSLHPTCKPVGLVADAIRDCSNLNGILLDPFGGAGTTLIAAERTGRRARLIEIAPGFVDCTVRRWQQLTG